MTEISGKSLHEIYKEDARKYKESIEKGRVYSESEDILTGNFDKSESLTVTMPMEEFDKLEKLALSAHTDKLSVEKLQEHLLPYKKETVQKIIDEKMQLVTADEFLKLHKESLTAIRENDKLQEQLNTAKKALTEIAEIINDDIHECDYSCDNHCELNGSLDMYSVENLKDVTNSVLAAIGGDNGQ
ncbi:prophage pi3 protein 34 [Lactococcus lactis subsp. lactis]|uniref:Prophage pi3 protein 34 n=1 Tax=Lactococcus lactis subsp. lactis TaxID=1360 RepID=A0A0V8DPY3_LACLL|nr:hypothetical protein [Lactococcus lactis]KSU15708.1 prophage pi3 protein 34 [Lactococcus lactis subsp. lactis]